MKLFNFNHLFMVLYFRVLLHQDLKMMVKQTIMQHIGALDHSVIMKTPRTQEHPDIMQQIRTLIHPTMIDHTGIGQHLFQFNHQWYRISNHDLLLFNMSKFIS